MFVYTFAIKKVNKLYVMYKLCKYTHTYRYMYDCHIDWEYVLSIIVLLYRMYHRKYTLYSIIINSSPFNRHPIPIGHHNAW